MMNTKEVLSKLETIKMNVNSIPVVGYDNCIKVVKAMAEILELQYEIGKEETDENQEGEET